MHFHPVPAHAPLNSIVALCGLDRITVRKEHYTPIFQNRDCIKIVHEDDPNAEMVLTHAEFGELLRTKKASIRYGFHRPEVKLLEILYNGRKFEDFDIRRKTLALMRQRQIHLWRVKLLNSDKKIPLTPASQEIIDGVWSTVQREFGKSNRCDVEVMGFNPPPMSTFKVLLRKYTKFGDNPLCLIQRHGGPGRKYMVLCPKAVSFATKEARAYLSRSKPTKEFVLGQYRAALAEENKKRAQSGLEPLAAVGRTKFKEIIKTFSAFDVMASRDGEDAALKHFTPVTRGFDVERPGARIEIDELKVNGMALFAQLGQLQDIPEELHEELEKVRVHFVIAIDVATRYILALHVTLDPSGEAASQALRMILTDKTLQSELAGAKTPWFACVLPEEMFMDNGSGFTSEKFVNLLKMLGISVTRPSAGNAPGRATVERVFGTLGPIFTSFYDGSTFRNVMEKGDRVPADFATLFVEELWKNSVVAVCDIYHNRPHSSLGGMTPHNAWVRACEIYGLRHPPGDEEMLHAFGKPGRAKISQYGIVHWDIPFGNEQLTLERMDAGQQEFDIKYDPQCINYILVHGSKGWFVVDNLLGFTTEVSEAEWLKAGHAPGIHDAKDAETSLSHRLDAINRLRRNGEAATLRANFDSMIYDETRLEKARKQVFHGYEPAPASGSPVALISTLTKPYDPLHDGAVGPIQYHELDDEPVADVTEDPSTSQFDEDDDDL
ncbi:DDE-type integrase/transposase/recombinase [Rhizobium sp.]|uniref:DDE-type integrase/transposase/recombinase n=1 Tax=Rhizobium sp. TaxID=391 RepID=UPI002896A031